jgi:hypothetical protein
MADNATTISLLEDDMMFAGMTPKPSNHRPDLARKEEQMLKEPISWEAPRASIAARVKAHEDERRRLLADAELGPMVIATDVMYEEWFQWLMAQVREHDPDRSRRRHHCPTEFYERLMSDGMMTREETVRHCLRLLCEWGHGAAVEGRKAMLMPRVQQVHEAECQARGITPGSLELTPDGQGYVIAGQSRRVGEPARPSVH